MNYLIYGNEQYLINREVNKIIKNNEGSLVVRFDGSFKDNHTDEILDNCKTDSLFSDKTLILYKNPPFLKGKADNESLNKFIDYLQNPNDNSIIVFYSSYSSFNSKLKAFKDISKHCETHYFTKLSEDKFNEYCNAVIKKLNLNFDNNAKNNFINECGNDLEIFHNCIKCLKEYDGVIHNETLEQLTYSSDDFNIFSLVNSIIERDISKSTKLIKKLRNDDFSIFGLISLVSSQLMYLYSVYYYSSVYDKESDILEATKTSNPYRLKMAYKTLKKISASQILSMINKLSILDYEFKTSSAINQDLLLDIFVSTLNS